jgi:hypothetical protein
MTVKELRKKLAEMPQGVEVKIGHPDGLGDIKSIYRWYDETDDKRPVVIE